MKKGDKKSIWDLKEKCPSCLQEGVTVYLRAIKRGEVVLFRCQDCSFKKEEKYAEGVNEPFCACGRRYPECDGSRRNCHKR